MGNSLYQAARPVDNLLFPVRIAVYFNYILWKERKCVMEIDVETERAPRYREVRVHESSAFYGLGFIGAAVYFIGTATTFWMGVLGFLKACVWPAFLVYEALKALY